MWTPLSNSLVSWPAGRRSQCANSSEQNNIIEIATSLRQRKSNRLSLLFLSLLGSSVHTIFRLLPMYWAISTINQRHTKQQSAAAAATKRERNIKRKRKKTKYENSTWREKKERRKYTNVLNMYIDREKKHWSPFAYSSRCQRWLLSVCFSRNR